MYTWRTSALVADGAIGHVAALGDGNGDLRLDPGSPGGAGQHEAQRQLGLCPMACTAEQQLLVGVRDAWRQP